MLEQALILQKIIESKSVKKLNWIISFFLYQAFITSRMIPGRLFWFRKLFRDPTNFVT